jgi:hypothetical protein
MNKDITMRKYIDMNFKTHELIVDLFNLIFGKSEETDHFWQYYIYEQTKSYFKVQEATRYYLL